MAELTINRTLALTKAVRERLNDLKHLRSEVSKKETHWFGNGNDNRKIIEPQYDIKKVDKKITELEKFLLETESEIKTSNAITKITIKSDTDTLLSPIE